MSLVSLAVVKRYWSSNPPAHALLKTRKSLFRLVRAVEQLRHETEPVAAVNARWLQKLREFLALAGSQTNWRSCWASLGHISGGC